MSLRLALSLSLTFLAPMSAVAQSTWLLPTDIQSKAEETAPKARVGWALPKTAPLKLNAAGGANVAPAERIEQVLFTKGTVITTGFAGTYQRKAIWRKDQPEPDQSDLKYRFINLNGASATLQGMDGLGFAMNGAELTRLPYDRLLARDIGQVFGAAIDNAEFRNLYLSATSAYGLQITAPDEDRDGVPERLYAGAENAKWMQGQWGSDVAAGPGSVWKVDGETGQISLFANITFEGLENAGTGLGNIAYDALHDQLFVSDLQSGMIHRLDLNGQTQEHFDHGLQLNDMPFDPTGVMDITSDAFDIEDADTWGFAPDERRVWGLAAQAGRLYYAVADGPSVYSVGLDRITGAFLDDAQFEFELPRAFGRTEISDMAFAGDGALMLAQRGARIGAFDFSLLTRPNKGAVLRYVKIKDPETGELVWTQEPRQMPIGFEQRAKQGLGGVAVGPAYDFDGNWDDAHCGGTLWSTGEALRINPKLEKALEIGGAHLVDGLQAQSAVLPLSGNAPPWQSYFVDYDRRYVDETRSGHIGDVEVVGCRGAGGLDEHYSEFDEDDGSGNTDCKKTPWLCPPPKPDCMEITATPLCNPVTGNYELVGQARDKMGHGLDQIKLSDPAETLSGFPVEQEMNSPFVAALTGLAAGQRAQVNVCGYSSILKGTGQPFPCCKATLVVDVPNVACVGEAN